MVKAAFGVGEPHFHTFQNRDLGGGYESGRRDSSLRKSTAPFPWNTEAPRPECCFGRKASRKLLTVEVRVHSRGGPELCSPALDGGAENPRDWEWPCLPPWGHEL